MRTIFSIIALSLALVSHSQVIHYLDISKSSMHQTSIDPQIEFVSGYNQINVNVLIRNLDNLGKDMADYDGDVLFLDNGFDRRYIVKGTMQEPIIFSPPGLPWHLPHSSACLTNDGKKAVYVSGNKTLCILDVDTQELIYQYTYEHEDPLKIEWVRINEDASLMFLSVWFDGIYHVFLFESNGTSYDITEAGEYHKTTSPFISSIDKRVYFQYNSYMSLPLVNLYGYIDPAKDNYQTLTKIQLPDFGNDFVEIVDIVEQGKVFILSVGQNSAGIKQTIRYHSVSMIDDTHFGEPSLIGEIVLNPYYDSMSRWPANSNELISYASKDGIVLISQVLKRVEMDKDYYYDAYAFLKNPAGSWIKKKINPDNVKIKDRMMLSGNGRCLFWNRWPAESGIKSPLY